MCLTALHVHDTLGGTLDSMEAKNLSRQGNATNLCTLPYEDWNRCDVWLSASRNLAHHDATTHVPYLIGEVMWKLFSMEAKWAFNPQILTYLGIIEFKSLSRTLYFQLYRWLHMLSMLSVFSIVWCTSLLQIIFEWGENQVILSQWND